MKKKLNGKLWKRKAAVREDIQRQLPSMASAYFGAGRKGLAEGTSWEEMHAFRLQTKRFRYTLETFRDAYGPGMEKRIESLKSIQTLLGDINDCIVTSEMLSTAGNAQEIREKLAERARRWTHKLQQYWAKSFDAPGEEFRWTRYLAHYACRPAQIPRNRRLSAPESPAE